MVKEKIKGCSNINCSIRANCKRANISNRATEEFVERNGRCISFIKNVRKEKPLILNNNIYNGVVKQIKIPKDYIPLNFNYDFKKLMEEEMKTIKEFYEF
jgi:hypothetical protein